MLRHVALLALLLSPAAVRVEQLASYTSLFAGGQAPALLNVRLAERAQALCYRVYAVVTSGITRGALWSAEHPTATGLAAARQT